jgi:hypothetical protein
MTGTVIEEGFTGRCSQIWGQGFHNILTGKEWLGMKDMLRNCGRQNNKRKI